MHSFRVLEINIYICQSAQSNIVHLLFCCMNDYFTKIYDENQNKPLLRLYDSCFVFVLFAKKKNV